MAADDDESDVASGQEDASLLPNEATRILVPLHGIRTFGGWRDILNDVVSKNGWRCRLSGWWYGYFNLVQFLLPWSRQKKIAWFQQRYDSLMQDKDLGLGIDEQRYPSVVAHSFGTYILGYALLRYPEIYVDKVILVGSILPKGFPWRDLVEYGRVREVLNEHSRQDVWPLAASYLISGAGSAGSYGFDLEPEVEDTAVRQARYNHGHSEYFRADHMRQEWLEFLESKGPSQRPPKKRTSPFETPTGDHPVLQALVPIVLLIFLLLALLLAGWSIWREFARDEYMNKTASEFIDAIQSGEVGAKITASRGQKIGYDPQEREAANFWRVNLTNMVENSSLIEVKGKVMGGQTNRELDVVIKFLNPVGLNSIDWIEVKGEITSPDGHGPVPTLTIANATVLSCHTTMSSCDFAEQYRNYFDGKGRSIDNPLETIEKLLRDNIKMMVTWHAVAGNAGIFSNRYMEVFPSDDSGERCGVSYNKASFNFQLEDAIVPSTLSTKFSSGDSLKISAELKEMTPIAVVVSCDFSNDSKKTVTKEK